MKKQLLMISLLSSIALYPTVGEFRNIGTRIQRLPLILHAFFMPIQPMKNYYIDTPPDMKNWKLTALHEAAATNDIRRLKRLLAHTENNVNVTTEGPLLLTPLDCALKIQQEGKRDTTEAIELLRSHGAIQTILLPPAEKNQEESTKNKE